jgi:hypothetical protein
LKKEMYLKSYRPVFNPIPAQHGWIKTEPDDIMPPAFKDHLKGRRQEKRRRGNLNLLNLWKLQEWLQLRVATANYKVTSTHPTQSHWDQILLWGKVITRYISCYEEKYLN